jgi:alanine racemase
LGTIRKIFNKITSPKIKYQPLIEVRVFKDALLNNLRIFQKKYPNLQIAPVIKSNAYGHGMVEVAKILDSQPKAFFMVDSFYEALVLRRAGIKSKILMLGFNWIEQLTNPRLKNCSMGIIDFTTLQEVAAKLKRPVSYHLKIDTGMHRQGLWGEEVNQAIGLIKSNPNFILEGLCSHLADADGATQEFTNRQIKLWNETAAKFKQNFPTIKYFHLANTAGTFFTSEITANVARIGIGLYGLNNSQFEKLDLKPALEMASIVSSVKTISAGEKVGYNITYQAPKEAKIATVPAGFNEGVDRRLSNKGFYRIKGQNCPLRGKVSMNISSVEVTDVPGVKVGDEVIIISRNPNDENSVENIAKMCGTVHYEILVHIPQHLRRIIM